MFPGFQIGFEFIQKNIKKNFIYNEKSGTVTKVVMKF